MSEIVPAAVKTLNEKLAGGGIDGVVKFVVEDEGVVQIDQDGASEAQGEVAADCTMTASAQTFRGILDGEVDPTAAFMSGRLRVEGEMGLAMELARILS
jgi:putative sterol carrier protein